MKLTVTSSLLPLPPHTFSSAGPLHQLQPFRVNLLLQELCTATDPSGKSPSSEHGVPHRLQRNTCSAMASPGTKREAPSLPLTPAAPHTVRQCSPLSGTLSAREAAPVAEGQGCGATGTVGSGPAASTCALHLGSWRTLPNSCSF